MSAAQTSQVLQERFSGQIGETVAFRGEYTTPVSPALVLEVLRYLRDEHGFDHLSDVTAVDWLDREPRFDVVYHLFSFASHDWYCLKVGVNEDDMVPSAVSLWPCANWAEREVYDLFGIVFEGHPDLCRIMMPEGWVGHPLRKDYPMSQITLPRSGATKIPE